MGSRMERLGAASGAVFVGLIVVSHFLVPAPPASDAAAGDIRAYFTSHHDALLAGALLSLIALPFFLGFLATLRADLAHAEGGEGIATTVLFGAALVLAGLALARTTLMAGMTQRIVDDGDQVMKGVYTLSLLAQAPLAIAGAAFLAAGSAVMVHTGRVARWLGWAGYGVAACSVVAACAIVLRDTTPLGVFGLIGFLGFALWVLAASVLMYEHRMEAPQPTATGARVAPA